MPRAPVGPDVVERGHSERSDPLVSCPHSGLRSGRKPRTHGKASCIRIRKMASFGICSSFKIIL